MAVSLADPVNGTWSFSDTTTPAPNADLDPLLAMPCVAEPGGVCAVPKDTMLVLPGTRTRIGFTSPPAQYSGLFVWHW